MVNNLPVKTLIHKELTIEGYSRAAVQTYWRIPELKLGFDLGGQPWSFMGTPTWFVSHAHMDHLVALPVYVARRRMMKMEPPTIYLPEDDRSKPIERILRLFSRLDRGRLPCKLRADAAGRRDRAVARAGGHRLGHPAHGALAGIRRLGAAAEAQARVPRPGRPPDSRSAARRHRSHQRDPRIPAAGLPGRQLAGRARRLPGDVPGRGADHGIDVRRPAHRKDKIHKFGHMHLDDVLERRERFQNELVIASHFSTRYHAQADPRARRRRLPDMLDGRLHLWL